MIYLKTDEEIELMRESNRILGMAYGEVAKAIAPGVTTADLSRIADEYTLRHSACQLMSSLYTVSLMIKPS